MRFDRSGRLVERDREIVALLDALRLAEVSGIETGAARLAVLVDVEHIIPKLRSGGRRPEPGDDLVLRRLPIHNLCDERRVDGVAGDSLGRGAGLNARRKKKDRSE